MRVFVISSLLMLAASVVSAQTSSQAEAPKAEAPSRGAIQLELPGTLESGKLKSGDAIQVKLAAGIKLRSGTVIPKGSLVTGHVESSSARSRGESDSLLFVQFDKLTASDGRSFSMKGIIQAVYDKLDDPNPERAGAVGERGPTFAGDNVNGSNPQLTRRAQYVVDTKAVGVYGVEDVQLEKGVLSSKGKQVKLIKGVRLVVAAEIS